MSAYIDQHRERFGVEPICEALGVSASAYYERATGARSARAVEDERLLGVIFIVLILAVVMALGHPSIRGPLALMMTALLPPAACLSPSPCRCMTASAIAHERYASSPAQVEASGRRLLL